MREAIEKLKVIECNFYSNDSLNDDIETEFRKGSQRCYNSSRIQALKAYWILVKSNFKIVFISFVIGSDRDFGRKKYRAIASLIRS